MQARQRPEQRGLAAAARPEHADELSVADRDREVLERMHASRLRLVHLRRVLDADLLVPRRKLGARCSPRRGRHQNHPSSSGFAYCMNSTTASPTCTNATVANPSPTSNGSASTSCPWIDPSTSSTRYATCG